MRLKQAITLAGRRLWFFLAIFGPGLITASADNDAPGIATYSMAGSTYGYGFLWLLLVVTFGERGLEIASDGSRDAACVRMSRADWLDVISGRVAIMSVVLAGRCPYPKDQRLPISKASVVLQSVVTMREAGTQ